MHCENMSIFVNKNGKNEFNPRVKKLNTRAIFAQKVKEDAQRELKRIFNALKLPQAQIESVLKQFHKIHPKLKAGTRMRNPKKLLPGIIFKHFQTENLPISRMELQRCSHVSKREFNESLIMINEFFKDHLKSNLFPSHRIQTIRRILGGITDQFCLPMEFYRDTEDILEKLWKYISYSTDNVIAATIASITSYCYYKGELTVSEISVHLGIHGSSVSQVVKKKIVEKLKIKGYKRLSSSSHVLREFLEIHVFHFSKQVRVIVKREQKMINA